MGVVHVNPNGTCGAGTLDHLICLFVVPVTIAGIAEKIFDLAAAYCGIADQIVEVFHHQGLVDSRQVLERHTPDVVLCDAVITVVISVKG